MEQNTKKAFNSNNKGYALLYELVSSRFMFEGSGHTGYGIVLTMKDAEGKILTTRTIRNITTVKKNAYDFLDLITRNFVTPDSIDDIVEDFLA